MKTNRDLAIVVVVIGLAIVGCRDEAQGLTARQIDQLLGTQEKIAAEQAALGRGRDALEADRRRWSERDRRDPIIAESIQGGAILIACSLPMMIVALLLWPKRDSDAVPVVDTPDLIEILSRDDLLIADRQQSRTPPALPSEEP